VDLKILNPSSISLSSFLSSGKRRGGAANARMKLAKKLDVGAKFRSFVFGVGDAIGFEPSCTCPLTAYMRRLKVR
jgi:hypothetical protein